MSISSARKNDDEFERLYRIEALAKEYKAALQYQGGSDFEWEDRLDAAQRALFKELGE